MTDIIKNAKQLLDGATPGPWEWSGYDLEQTFDAGGAIVMDTTCENPHLGGVVNVEITPEDERLIAAAPENTQALAEETWEYAVQVKRSESWKYTYESWGNRWQGSYSVQEVRAQRDHPGEETRIVRRRVSEPEVINE